MELYWYVMVFILGAVIGSFLNVVIYRFHTGRSLSGRSHCMSCGKILSWYELVPIFSYLSQKGSCRGCQAYIPPRYFVVEVLTALLFVSVWHIMGNDLTLALMYAVLVSLFVVILIYDIRHTIIPDELSLGVLGVALVIVGYEYISMRDVYLVGTHVLGGALASLFFWGLWFASKGKWIGLGDAKLAFPLGVIVGLGGVFSMVVLSFWVGAGISLSLLGIERISEKWKTHLHFLATPLTIKSEVPFAPFLIIGFLLVQFVHADIFTITNTFFIYFGI
jgi:leader peptidase (prepilin peptidase)/N-methyltransferase